MKLTIGKRILMFFHWLFSLLICGTFALYIIKPELVRGPYDRVAGGLTPTQAMVIGIALLAVYVVLAVVQACFIFGRDRKSAQGFITVDASDAGRVRISVPAIEQMVRQAVINIDGISHMEIGIKNADDAIALDIVATLVNGCHVPTVTMNMQQAIRKFVELNCGVAVRTVSISIDSVSNVPAERRKGRRGFAEVPPTPEPVPETANRYAAPEPGPVREETGKLYEEPKTIRGEPVDGEPVAQAPTADEPAFDIPEARPIKLTLDYPAPDSEAPETVGEE